MWWAVPRVIVMLFFFSSRRRHTRLQGDWSSDVCSSDLLHKFADVPGNDRRLSHPLPAKRRCTLPCRICDQIESRRNRPGMVRAGGTCRLFLIHSTRYARECICGRPQWLLLVRPGESSAAWSKQRWGVRGETRPDGKHVAVFFPDSRRLYPEGLGGGRTGERLCNELHL